MAAVSWRSIEVLKGTLEFLEPAMEHRDAAGFEAVLERLANSQVVESLHIYDPEGRLVAGGLSGNEDLSAEVSDFLRRGENERGWLHNDGDRVHNHSLLTIESRTECQSCHEDGGILGVAAVNLDITAQVESMQGRFRTTMLTVFTAWVAIAVFTSVLVKRSVKRSAASLQADLEAVESGEPAPEHAPALVLDPVSAELHDSLRRFLRHQREEQTELASRLEHTVQLASLGQIAAGLAHEIKNPLAGISGAVEILRDECPEETTRQLYEQMLTDLSRVNGTIQSLLDLSRPAPPTPVQTDVAQLLEDTLQLLKPTLKRRSISIDLEVAAGLPLFRLDPDRMRQVLVNLVNNAAEAIGHDGRIAVRCTTFPKGGGIIIAVEDDGPGIAEDLLSRVFNPFFTTKLAGTGLGLSLAKTLVEQHRGRLEVKSDPGLGSTFYIFLPEGTSSAEPEPAGAE